MNNPNLEIDYLIIGAGVIGLTLARELKGRYPNASIAIVEKEPDVAYHSSGRNSGVLHAGFYYTSDSLKAKFTCEGNALMRQYCNDNNLRINECKKVVVAMNEQELESLYELERRGKANGVDVRLITTEELEKIDPNAVTFKYALWSPNTATVDPVEVCKCFKNELIEKGVKIFFDEPYQKRINGNTIKTAKHTITAKKIINAAGLYADKIAKNFGYSKNYTIIPRSEAVKKKMQELKEYEDAGHIDDRQLIEWGRQHNVQVLCLVTAAHVEEYMFSAQLTDVKTNTLLGNAEYEIPSLGSEDLKKAAAAIAGQLLNQLRRNNK